MVKFGVQLWQEEFDFDALKKAWREVEDMGYDSVWIYDHFYPMSQKTSKYILEAWTLLPSLATETHRLRFGMLVTCNSYRFPSVLAKIAATVDVMSGGRLEFGIGAGWHKEEYDAYGIPFPDARIRVEQLAEAIELIKRIWTQEKANFQGEYYTVRDVVSFPKPLQKPHPPIWIGGQGSMLLKIVAQHADYANFVKCSVEEFRQRLKVLKRHCLNLGRKFEAIEKTWHGLMIISDREEEVKRRALKFQEDSAMADEREMSFDDFLNRNIMGTPEQCVEKIRRYVDLGVTYFIPHFPFAEDLRGLRIFMDEVVPAFK